MKFNFFFFNKNNIFHSNFSQELLAGDKVSFEKWSKKIHFPNVTKSHQFLLSVGGPCSGNEVSHESFSLFFFLNVHNSRKTREMSQEQVIYINFNI